MAMQSTNTHRSDRLASTTHTDIKSRGSVVRAIISGPRIGERESQIIAREIHSVIESHGRSMKHLVLDLTDVRTMSSLGLGMCIDVRNAAHKRGANTLVIGLDRELRDLFRMMKVDRLYLIVSSEDELRERLRA